MNKILELAKKLKALADRGEGGEKLNAAKKLQTLMSKHGISLQDIEDVTRKYEIFECKHIQKRIFYQCIYLVMGKDVNIYGHKKKRNAIIVECTKAEFIEIQAAFDFFWEGYEQELELFTQAFIHKNRILPHDADQADLENMSKEELEELKRLLNMMEAIEKRTFNKQLCEGANLP